jgi:prophage maintenance system killer protein
MIILTVQEIISVHEKLISATGGSVGIRDRGRVNQIRRYCEMDTISFVRLTFLLSTLSSSRR